MSAAAPATEVVTGLVAWTHPSSKPTWTLGDLIDQATGQRVRFVAKFSLRKGQLTSLEGQWDTHPKFGRQFTVRGVTVEAIGPDGMRLWLEREVSGCGKARADLAVQAYGDGLYEAVRTRPDEVAERIGVSADALRQAAAHIDADKAVDDATGRLAKKIGQPGLAKRVIDNLGAQAVQTVLDDPYYMIGRVPRVGWKLADEVATHLGVPKDAPCRLRAAVDCACRELSEGLGHTAYGEAVLLDAVQEALGLPAPTARAAVAASERVVQVEPGLYAHAAYARHERNIEAACTDNPRLLDGPAVEQLAGQFAVLPSGAVLEGRQLEAFKAALYNRVSLITGAAGSGKTSITRCITNAALSLYGPSGVCLLAPTGKAAVRIGELADYPAFTIHRGLGLVPGETPDGRQEAVPRNIMSADQTPPAQYARTVIVDEFSMCDVGLAAKLMTMTPPDCRIVLIGDPNQLPSVGPGAVLRDLGLARAVPHVHLDVCHRQAGLLKHNCFSILAGGRPEVYDRPTDLRDAPWALVASSTADSIRTNLSRLFAGSCREKLGVEPYDLMVLTPTNKGRLGTWALNVLIQAEYQRAHHARRVEYRPDAKRYQFFPGDRVIWTRNNYQLNLMNGELGLVEAAGSGWTTVRFDTRAEPVTVQTAEANDLSLAWVITCHKAQGSQFRKVIALACGEHVDSWGLKTILNRSWLYTSGTRSTDATVLFGSPDSVRDVIARNQRDDRVTTLFRGRS
jgi:exodeoxyribonuclease V alpha subunit